MKRHSPRFILCLLLGLAFCLSPVGTNPAQAQQSAVAVAAAHISGADLAATDFFSLDLQSHLAGFWGGIPRADALHLGPILVAPWSMTASGDNWQVWSQASASRWWQRGGQAAGLRSVRVDFGLDRSFQDRWLLGLAFNAGSYRYNRAGLAAPIRNAFYGGSLYAGVRLPYELELTGFFGGNSYECGPAQTNLRIWHGGLSLGRSYLILPGLTLRPSLDWELFKSGAGFSGFGQADAFSQQRFRLGLQINKQTRRAVLRGQLGFELWRESADSAPKLARDPDVYLSWRLEAAWRLGRRGDLGLAYQGRIGSAGQTHGFAFDLRMVF